MTVVVVEVMAGMVVLLVVMEGSFAPRPSVTTSRSGRQRSGIDASSPFPAGPQQTRPSDTHAAPRQLLACGTVPGKKACGL